MIMKASSFFAASVLIAYTQASKLRISQTADNMLPECCTFYTEENFTGLSFELCMEKVLDVNNPFNVERYKQASRALTDDTDFDD